MFGQFNRLIKQVLVRHGLATAHAGVGGNDQRRLGIIDTGGQRTGSKTAENHRVNGSNAGGSENGKTGLSHHRHVNQHAVTALDAQALVNRRHALDFALQFGKAVNCFFVGFC
ncbi:MAG: hypothetical protein ACD_10C00455G0003 [uncultured bacterium]|nr:MAG: hypothetical protein ACD_10C00455G0003 [uncultured bacterium]